jgi:polyisoprenoid-binding protein YceI
MYISTKTLNKPLIIIMNTRAIFGTIATLSLLAASRAADTYNIDPMHSSVGFSVQHMVINKVRGKFTEFQGSVVVDGKTIQSAKGTIQTKSVDTGIARRDNHLRSPDFFDATKYPTITFVSKRVENKGGDTVLVGDYTMHGVTKELSMPVTLSGPIKDNWGGERIGLEAKTKLNRRDYGLTYNQALETGGLVVGDEIELEINAEAVKAK